MKFYSHLFLPTGKVYVCQQTRVKQKQMITEFWSEKQPTSAIMIYLLGPNFSNLRCHHCHFHDKFHHEGTEWDNHYLPNIWFRLKSIRFHTRGSSRKCRHNRQPSLIVHCWYIFLCSLKKRVWGKKLTNK